ncbi:Cyclin-C1-1 [Entamoeba marina]
MQHQYSTFEESTHYKYGLYSPSSFIQDEEGLPYQVKLAVHIQMIQFLRSLCSQCRSSLRGSYHRVYSTSSIYYRHSIDPRLVATASVYFASKVEGSPVPPNTIIETTKSIIDFPFSIKEMISSERQLIIEIKHTIFVFHPEKCCDEIYRSSHLPEFFYETLQSILNDAYLTDVVLLYEPAVITLGCIVTAGVLQNCDIRSLLCSTQVGLEKIQDVANHMLNHYIFVNSPEYSDYEKRAKEFIQSNATTILIQ